MIFGIIFLLRSDNDDVIFHVNKNMGEKKIISLTLLPREKKVAMSMKHFKVSVT